MDDKINLHCQRCGADWQKSLAALNKLQTTVYRTDKNAPMPKTTISEYRDRCPGCGTYVIATVEED